MRHQRLTREESRERTRARLLEAASEAFSRSGYAGTSVNEIADYAGCTKGGFYSNFDSKESIFLELLEQHKNREVGALQKLLSAGHDAAQLPQKIAEYYRETCSDMDWGMLSAEFQFQASRDKQFAERFGAYFSEHRTALAKLLDLYFGATKQSAPKSMEEFASILMALSVGLALQQNALSAKRNGVFGDALYRLLGGEQ